MKCYVLTTMKLDVSFEVVFLYIYMYTNMIELRYFVYKQMYTVG